MRKIVVLFDERSNQLWITSNGKPKVFSVLRCASYVSVKFGWASHKFAACLNMSGHVWVRLINPGISVEPGELIYYGGVFISITSDKRAMMANTICTVQVL